MAELLTYLIEEFEGREYELPRKAGPIEILRHLMEANDLRQADLLDVFGTASVISEAHIAKLSDRFRISPELFF